MDKICDKCGCKNPYSALYCRFCGNKFGNKEGEVIASLEISEQDVIDESRSLKLAHESEITSLKEQIQLIQNENASLLNRYNFIKKVNSANEFELSKLRGYKSDEEHVVNELKSSNDSLSKENSDLKTAIATILLLLKSQRST